MEATVRRRCVIPEGWIPPESVESAGHALASHETVLSV